MAGVGHLKRIWKDACRAASQMLGRQGADFLRRVAFWERQIFRFAKMILRFDFQMCFAPQWIQWHAIFPSLIWPDGSAPATLASLLFDPPGATNHWKKTSESRIFYIFARLHLLSCDAFSSLIFSSLLFPDSSHLCFSICR